MFNQLAKYRNHFLQFEEPHLEAEYLNKLVKEEFHQETSKSGPCEFPYLEDCSYSTWFDDHAPLAYGWWAFPKLLRDLCSGHLVTEWRAINSLTEFLKNPLNAQKALENTELFRKLQNIFFRKRKGLAKDLGHECEKICKIFAIISFYLKAAQEIPKRTQLMDEFYSIIMKRERNMEGYICKMLRNCTEKSLVVNYMLQETNAFDHLAAIYAADPCAPDLPEDLWHHLCHLIEIAPEEGIKRNFFTLLLQRIGRRLPGFHLLPLKCFALLLRCESGQQLFDKVDGVKIVHELLVEKPPLDNYEYVVLTFQNGMVSKRALWRCCQFTDMAVILLKLAQLQQEEQPKYYEEVCSELLPLRLQERSQAIVDEQLKHLQLYCLVSLRQMTQVPCLKRFVKKNLMYKISEIDCVDKFNQCLRDDLVRWLEYKVFHTHLSFFPDKEHDQ